MQQTNKQTKNTHFIECKHIFDYTYTFINRHCSKVWCQ